MTGAEVPAWRAGQDSSMFELTKWLRRLDDEARVNSGGVNGATFVVLCLSENGWSGEPGTVMLKPSTFSEPAGLPVIHRLLLTFHALFDAGHLTDETTMQYDAARQMHVPEGERPPDPPM